MKPTISNHASLIRIYLNKFQLEFQSAVRPLHYCLKKISNTSGASEEIVHLQKWPYIRWMWRLPAEDQNILSGFLWDCSTSSAGFFFFFFFWLLLLPRPHFLLAKVHPGCHTSASHLRAPTDDRFLTRASKNSIISHPGLHCYLCYVLGEHIICGPL